MRTEQDMSSGVHHYSSAGCGVSEDATGVRVAWHLYLPVGQFGSQRLGFFGS